MLTASAAPRFRVPRAFNPAAIMIVVFAFAAATALMAIDEVRNDDPIIWMPIALNGIVAVCGLALSGARDGVSLRVVFWLYNLLFFGIAPLAQYLTGKWSFPPSEGAMLTANVLILFSSSVYAISYSMGRAAHERTSALPWGRFHHAISQRRSIHMLILSGAISFGFGAATGFKLTASSVIGAFGAVYTPSTMIAEFTLRPFPFFVFLFTVYQAKYGARTLRSLSIAIFAGAFAFIMLSPISGARFFIFAMYFGLYVVLFPPIGKYRFVYVLLLYMGLFGSQFISAFAAWVTGRAGTIQGFDANYFYAGHFDGYENLCHSIDYVRENGIVWGKQFLGALLFWVPRTWWPTKPIGSAAYIATSYLSTTFNVTFTNLASPLVQEAYLNFGSVGVGVVFSAIGYFSGKCDAKFQLYSRLAPAAFRLARTFVPGDHLGFMILYPVVLGLSLFLLRGDFLSGFAFTSGIVTAFVIVVLAVRRRIEWAHARGT